MKTPRSQIRRSIQTSFLSISAAAALVACSQWASQWSSSQLPFAPLSVEEASVKLNYAYVQGNILIPYCINCHGSDGGINLESISNIRANSQKILAAIAPPGRMPKGSAAGQMTLADRQVLYDWVNSGAPVGTGPIPNPIRTYPPLSDADAKLKLNYTYIRDNIMIPKCVSCHNNTSKLNLEDFATIQKNSHSILVAVLGARASMPPNRPATDQVPAFRSFNESEYQVFYNWLALGAPEGFPTEPLPPVQPTFADIDKRIFQTHCMDCHEPGTKTGKGDPLTKDGLVGADGSVKAGDPDHSDLIAALELTGPPPTDPDALRPMPPAKKGYVRLPQEQIDVIRLWIKNGAKD